MKKISKLTICLTNICDMHCDYCYRNESSIISKPNKFTFWQDLLLYIKNTKDFEFDNNLSIHFTGGEPILFFYDMLEGIITLKALNRLKGISTKFGMITNLTDPNNLLALLDNNFMQSEEISISWDYTGDYKELINITLLSELIEKNYDKVYKKKYYDMCIKMAVTKKTIGYLYNGLLYLKNLGFTNIGYYFVNGTDDYNDENVREEFRNQLEKINNDYDLKKFVRNYSEFMWEYPRPFCTKLGELLYIDTEGGIWPCAFLSDDSKVHGIKNIKEYKIGDIFNGINKYRSHIVEPTSLDWVNRFCPACSIECKEKIRAMKQIEIDVFSIR